MDSFLQSYVTYMSGFGYWLHVLAITSLVMVILFIGFMVEKPRYRSYIRAIAIILYLPFIGYYAIADKAVDKLRADITSDLQYVLDDV